MSKEDLPVLPPAVTNKGFTLKEKIGEGGFATVYRASWTQRPNEDIAAKIISKVDASKQDWVLKNLNNEMKILRRLNHPNVIRCYDLIKTSTSAYIFMEFAKNGNVLDLLRKREKGFEEPTAKKYMRDISRGLAYVHSVGVAHRDIKPENFLVDHKEKVMLSDFGFACISATRVETKLMKGTTCGTSEYQAIEIKLLKEGEAYDAKASDLYSLGISLYTMVYYDFPFDPRNEREMIRKQRAKEFKHKSQIPTSEALKDLIDKLLDPNPKTRITSNVVLRHQWLFY